MPRAMLDAPKTLFVWRWTLLDVYFSDTGLHDGLDFTNRVSNSVAIAPTPRGCGVIRDRAFATDPTRTLIAAAPRNGSSPRTGVKRALHCG